MPKATKSKHPAKRKADAISSGARGGDARRRRDEGVKPDGHEKEEAQIEGEARKENDREEAEDEAAPTQSGFSISSLPAGLTQSTPKPPPPTTDSPANPPHSSTSTPTPTTLLLQATYTLTTLSVISSTQITKRVRAILDALAAYPPKQGEKDRIVVVSAKGEVAGKAISVVEIAKREITARGGKWFQYTAVEGRVEEVKVKNGKVKTGKDEGKDAKSGKEGKEGDRDGDGNGEDGQLENEEEEGFEVMKTPFERTIEGRPKVREVPVMVIYLSRCRVDLLRKQYGEQTNAEKAK